MADASTRLERIYRSLLIAYPPDFRADYGEEMLTVFHDQLRAARRRGVRGIAHHLYRTAIDQTHSEHHRSE